MTPRPNPQHEQQAVIEFNHLHRVGVDVIVRLDDGFEKPTKTISEAWLLGGHSAVVMPNVLRRRQRCIGGNSWMR